MEKQPFHSSRALKTLEEGFVMGSDEDDHQGKPLQSDNGKDTMAEDEKDENTKDQKDDDEIKPSPPPSPSSRRHHRPMTWGEASQFDVLFSEDAILSETTDRRLSMNGYKDQESMMSLTSHHHKEQRTSHHNAEEHKEQDNPIPAAINPFVAEESQLEVLMSEDAAEQQAQDVKFGRLGLLYRRESLQMPKRTSFWDRVMNKSRHSNHDPYFEYLEGHTAKVGLDDGDESSVALLEIPTLWDCKLLLRNDLADEEKSKNQGLKEALEQSITNYLAAILIYISTSVSVEALLVTMNALGATSFYCANHDKFATRLNFAFLSVAVVFPLTFLISSTFQRREQALIRLADFKACIMSSVLFTLTVDWAMDGKLTKGRLKLPENFNANVCNDFVQIVQLVYEYLSMPNVAHTRNVVMWSKQKGVKRVRAAQNDIMKRLNEIVFDLSMHTEIMRQCGFSSSEASRLHQFHQHLQQRVEYLRVIKYYRTPLATRSFGRAYIIILPWIMGPYYAFVFESTGWAFTLILSCFTSLILLGLLNTQLTLEDPFISVPRSWTPGIDDVKLDLEMATLIQAIKQFEVTAELHRLSAMKRSNSKESSFK